MTIIFEHVVSQVINKDTTNLGNTAEASVLVLEPEVRSPVIG